MRKLFLFPGLGADQRLFVEQRAALGFDVVTPPWIMPLLQEDLGSYARRFAEVFTSHDHKTTEPISLAGFSFGGMFALELAQVLTQDFHVPVTSVFLISSARTRRIVTARFSLQVRLMAIAPNSLLRLFMTKMMLPYFAHHDHLSDKHSQLLREQLDEIDLVFFRWAARASVYWQPEEKFLLSTLPFEIYEIQGARDRIIPLSTESDVTTLETGAHLIQYTHAQEVNQWLTSHLRHG